MSDSYLLLFAKELRDRAKEILVRAASTDDPEAQGMMRVIAAGYVKLAQQAEQRIRDAYKDAVAAQRLRGEVNPVPQ